MRTIQSIAIALGVVVPYSAATAQGLRPPVQGPAGTVTLPVADYDRLVDRAAQSARTPEPPPVAAVVGRGEIRARVSAGTARGTLRLDGQVFHRGQVKVRLVTGATLLEASADGRPLPLLHEGDAHAAVLPGAAPFSVTLEWAAPVTAAPGRTAFLLPTAASGSVSAVVDLPGDPSDVQVEGGVVTRRETADGRTRVDVTIQPGRRAQVSWSARETGTAPVQAATRMLADVRSLVTIGDADLRMVSLVEAIVIRGEPREFEVRFPEGYEVTAVTGASIDTTAVRPGGVRIVVRDASQRRHQFLVSLERPHGPGSFKAAMSFPTLSDVQREAGEVAIEGIGTIEVAASGDEQLRRMDVRETHAALRSLARQPLLGAFRYQRRPGETRVLTLDVTRFADAPVIAAAADRAIVTTLVTVEGRTLTEVQLTIRNRAQPFMKVTLPPGASMVTVDVAGEPAKPVSGPDGTRVPLLRTGFRPEGPYLVSFVYLHAGQPFAKRGETDIALPTLDVPISVLEWELFLPEQYSAKARGGNVVPARLAERIPPTVEISPGTRLSAAAGQIDGRVTDGTGAAIPGATVTATGADGVRRTATSDAEGFYTLDRVPSGRVTVTSELPGFKTVRRSFVFDQRPRLVEFRMEVSALTETVTVTAEAPYLDVKASERSEVIDPNAVGSREGKLDAPQQQAVPSQNVLNLQRRVAGVLPVRVDVPHAGTSHRFVRPLVLEEETRVTFAYKRR